MEKGLVLDFVGLSECQAITLDLALVSHRNLLPYRNPPNLSPSPLDRRLSLLLPTLHSLRRLPCRPNTSRISRQTPPAVKTISIEIEAEEDRIGTSGGCGLRVGTRDIQRGECDRSRQG